MPFDRFLGMLAMPLLFVLLHFVGLILALVYWQRCPAACSLLFTGSILNLIGSIGRIGLPFVVAPGGLPFFGTVMSGLTFLNWLGYGLLLMAIFAGRNEPTHLPARSPRPLPDDDDEFGVPPGSTTDRTGIQVK